MGIHGLTKLLGDHAPSSMKENEIKNYFGKTTFFCCKTYTYSNVIAMLLPLWRWSCFYILLKVI